jgi:hypothetical protein
VARNTILSLAPLLFRLQTPLPVHGRQIASKSAASTTDSRPIRKDVYAHGDGQPVLAELFRAG